jgi:uncharacterized membrane protein
MPRLKMNRPFQVTITAKDKANLRANAKWFGVPYGVFFTSSGAAYYEAINPSAQYGYVWRTDKTERKTNAKSQPRQARTQETEV